MSQCADGGSNVLFGPRGACNSCGGCTSDKFSVCGHFSRGSIARSKRCGTACPKKMSDESFGLGTARWTCDESGGSVTSCQRSWMQSTSCATEQTCQSVRSNWVASKIGRILETHSTTLALVMRNNKSQSLLPYVADLGREQHRRGGRLVLTFPWKCNILKTWALQSVPTEAPFLCACEGENFDELC